MNARIFNDHKSWSIYSQARSSVPPQNSINEFIIRKLSPLAVGVDKSRNMPEQEK